MSDDEGAVKDAISNLAQKNMLEFFQRSILLEANLVVARNESEQLLNNINDLRFIKMNGRLQIDLYIV